MARDNAQRRLCLAQGGQLAGGVSRPRAARSRNPRASRGRERLPGGDARGCCGAPRDAGRRNARPHQGGRFLRADEGRPLCLRHVLRQRRRAPTLPAHGARRQPGNDPHRRRPRGGRQGVFPHRRRRPFARPRTPAVGLRRQGIGVLHAAGARHRDRRGLIRNGDRHQRLGHLERRRVRFPLHARRPQPSAVQGAVPSHRRHRRPARLRGNGSRLLHECRRDARQELDLHLDFRPRDVGIPDPARRQ